MQPIKTTEIPAAITDYLKNIKSIKFPRQGCTSDVGIIESTQGTYALKRAKGDLYCSWLDKEIVVLNCLSNQTTLPVPKVIKYVKQAKLNECWALLEFIEGETVRAALSKEENKEQRRKILANFGAILAQIHATPCPGELRNTHWLSRMLEEADFYLENYQVDGNKELLEKMKKTKPTSYVSTLIHGDFTIDNVLVSAGEITGVIDWGRGDFGDPRYDAALAVQPRTNIFDERVDKELFFKGYGDNIIDKNIYDFYVNGLYEFF